MISENNEYDTLRSELLQNKQYVFERPIVILTASGIAYTQIPNSNVLSSPAIIISLILVILLFINLNFTINRIKSLARISSYISLFLESNPRFKWIGWESSLRLSRSWQSQHNDIKSKKAINDLIDKNALPESMMFYNPIFWIHLIPVLLIFVVTIYYLIFYPHEIVDIVISGLTILLSIIFIFSCLKVYRPSKMRDLIERCRVIWILSFKENNGKRRTYISKSRIESSLDK